MILYLTAHSQLCATRSHKLPVLAIQCQLVIWAELILLDEVWLLMGQIILANQEAPQGCGW